MKYILWCLLGIVGLILAFLIVYLIVMTVSALVVDTSYEREHDSRYYRNLFDFSLRLVFFVARIKIVPEGLDKMPDPQAGPMLFVSNHRSKFDPMVMWLVFKKYKLAFISKEANFHIPWFGRFIRMMCCMAVDREDPRQSLMTFDKAAGLMEKGEVSVGVYPEGTRSTDYKLLPFHNGVFKMAQKAGVPIVVCTVRGTELIHKQYIRHRTIIQLKVEEVIPAEEVALHKRTSEIGERVRRDMLNTVE